MHMMAISLAGLGRYKRGLIIENAVSMVDGINYCNNVFGNTLLQEL